MTHDDEPSTANGVALAVLTVGLLLLQLLLGLASLLTAMGGDACHGEPSDPYMCRADWAWPTVVLGFWAVLLAIDVVVLRRGIVGHGRGRATWWWPAVGAVLSVVAGAVALVLIGLGFS